MKVINCLAGGILALLMLQSCSVSDESFICTDEFVMISVLVLGPDGEPAESVEVEVRNKQTGDLYDICEGNNCETFDPGKYIIMHDGFKGEISSRIERVMVSGTKGSLSFEEEFAFRSGRCHVEKIAGPDKVTLS